MSNKWTASLVGKMHIWNITQKALAAKMEVTPEYVSVVLKGHRTPKNARERFNHALDELIREKEQTPPKEMGRR